jgi:hypothetical protein
MGTDPQEQGEGTTQEQGEGLTPHDPTQGTEPAALTEEQQAQVNANSVQGDEGPQVREQDPAATGPGVVASSDPNVPVAQSPPPPSAQSGVPALQGQNEGVEPQPEYASGTDGNDTTRAAEGGAAVTEGGNEPE